LNGEKVAVATTVGNDCILGASVALNADRVNLTEAYKHFKDGHKHCPQITHLKQSIQMDGVQHNLPG